MSTLEIVVVLSGLFLGYWIVSRFLLGGTSARASAAASAQNRARETARNEKTTSASWDKILGVSPDASIDVSPDASIDEIRRAYKLLISQYHPDKVASLGDELKDLAEHKSKEITQAYREALRMRGEEV